MGPMAQDFWGAFELGSAETMISLGDLSGVALASTQELYKRLKDKETRIDDLEQQNKALEDRLQRIEEALKLSGGGSASLK